MLARKPSLQALCIPVWLPPSTAMARPFGSIARTASRAFISRAGSRFIGEPRCPRPGRPVLCRARRGFPLRDVGGAGLLSGRFDAGHNLDVWNIGSQLTSSSPPCREFEVTIWCEARRPEPDLGQARSSTFPSPPTGGRAPHGRDCNSPNVVWQAARIAAVVTPSRAGDGETGRGRHEAHPSYPALGHGLVPGRALASLAASRCAAARPPKCRSSILCGCEGGCAVARVRVLSTLDINP